MINQSSVLYRELNSSPTQITNGEGVYIFDEAGNKLLDGMASAAVVAIGHGRTEIYRKMGEAASHIPFVYGAGFTHPWQEELAKRIISIAPESMEAVYFVSGGSEANESAIKLARQYFIERGKPQKHKVIARWQSYHGVTLATLALSGRTSWRSMFEPYLMDVAHIEPPYEYRCRMCNNAGGCNLQCADDLERMILLEGPENIAMFFAETVIGTTATAVVPSAGYYKRVREICDKYDILFVADEVLCGYGRTGRAFAIDHWDVIPDIITMGKGIASGYTPLGAIVVRDRVLDALRDGSGRYNHGFTYSGNPASCFIGIQVFDIMQNEGLFEKGSETGPYLIDKLGELQSKHDCIGEVRGIGLLVGLEFVANRETRKPFDIDAKFTQKVVSHMRTAGVLVNPGVALSNFGKNGDHLQISPPLIITHEEIDEIIGALDTALTDVIHDLNFPDNHNVTGVHKDA